MQRNRDEQIHVFREAATHRFRQERRKRGQTVEFETVNEFSRHAGKSAGAASKVERSGRRRKRLRMLRALNRVLAGETEHIRPLRIQRRAAYGAGGVIGIEQLAHSIEQGV